jgi:hypothetical protein
LLWFHYFQNEKLLAVWFSFKSFTNYSCCFHVGMKLIMWNGNHYIVKVANLWANWISSYPPQMSFTPVVEEQRSNTCQSRWITRQTSDLFWWKHWKLFE